MYPMLTTYKSDVYVHHLVAILNFGCNSICLGFNLIFGQYLGFTFQSLTLLWLRITDEGSILHMRIWSILLIQFDLKMVFLSKQKSIFVLNIHISLLWCSV